MAYRYRPVTEADLDLICRHRHEMFRSAGRPEDILQSMTAAFRPWLASRLRSGDYFGWIAEAGPDPVGGLGMMIIDWPPHPSHPDQAARGYILNVYVEPPHRGKGIARTLMNRAHDDAQRRRIGFLVLHATEAGRELYRRLGWRETSEMSISVEPALREFEGR